MLNLSRKIIQEVLRENHDIRPFLSEKALKAVGGYQLIRDEYFIVIYDSVRGYLESNLPTTSFRNRFAEAMSTAFTDAVYLGYENGGGELPLDSETSSWLSLKVAEQRTFIDSLFERLFDLRRSDDFEKDLTPITEAQQRADGYTATLDAIYSESKMRGSNDLTLIFGGNPGKDGCPTCRKLEGKRHRISWILKNDMIPRPGNTNFECRGYNCHHYWFNPLTGEEYTF